MDKKYYLRIYQLFFNRLVGDKEKLFKWGNSDIFMGFIIIYITHKNQEEAEKIVKHLLNKKLIACGNIFPIKSFYWWKGKIENSDEVVSIVKTKNENWEKLKKEVKKVHSYEVPCIMKIGVEGDEGFEKWINEETK